MKTVFILVLYSITSIFGHQLPSNFKICKQSDPNVNECLKTAIQDALSLIKNGLPEFNVPRIDPIDVESLVIGEGTGAVHLTQNYKNVNIYGLTTSMIESVEFKGNDGDITLVTIGKVPELRLEADYDINGKILVMPVVGEGKCTIKLEEVNTTMTIKAKPFHRKGVTYSSIEEFLVTMAPKKMETIFENLFDGDAAMGAEMNKLINDNWVEVFSDVKNGYEEAFGLIFKNVANQIFKKVAFNDMFPL